MESVRNLTLVLSRKWWEMYHQGIKKEDYREITRFWAKRLVSSYNSRRIFPIDNPNWLDNNVIKEFRNYDTVSFPLGYSEDRPVLVYEFKGIEIRKGNPEWGAEEGKEYFVIKIGKLLE